MKKIILAVFSIIILTSGISIAIAESETLVVDPGYQRWYSMNLVKGATFSGEFTVNGGSGDDIDFWVEDPTGYQIIPERRVSLDYSFNFEAQREGTYRIYFDNSMSTFSNKAVSFSYNIQNPIVPGGGCLIATATYGTEFASQVQTLREIRQNVLFSTNSGTAFLSGFNDVYYMFSPTIADWERQSPIFKETVKGVITPMLSTLLILQFVDVNSESEMLGYGIGIILLNAGVYFVAPALVIIRVRKYFNKS